MMRGIAPAAGRVLAKDGCPPHLAVLIVKGSFGIRHRQGVVCSGRSLTRQSPALNPSAPASASPGSTPWRTRAFDQLVWPGGR
jgi:hypothetical protein